MEETENRNYNSITLSLGENILSSLDKIFEVEKRRYINNCKTKKEKKKINKHVNKSLIINKLIKTGIEIRSTFGLPYGIYEGVKKRICITIGEELDEKIEKIVERETEKAKNPGNIPVSKCRIIEDLLIKGISAKELGY